MPVLGPPSRLSSTRLEGHHYRHTIATSRYNAHEYIRTSAQAISNRVTAPCHYTASQGGLRRGPGPTPIKATAYTVRALARNARFCSGLWMP